MSLLTARNTSTTESAHTTSIAVRLLALPLALLAAAAYGPTVANFVGHVFVQVGRGGSKISNLPLDAAFAAIIGVTVVAISLAVHEQRKDEDRDVFDVR